MNNCQFCSSPSTTTILINNQTLNVCNQCLQQLRAQVLKLTTPKSPQNIFIKQKENPNAK